MARFVRVEHVDGKKHCSVCKTFLPLETFCKQRRSWDGLNARCRSCMKAIKTKYAGMYKEQTQGYRDAHREEIRARQTAKKDDYNAARKARREANPEAVREVHRAWCKNNKDRLAASSRKCYLKYRERRLAEGRAYRQANPHIVLAATRRRRKREKTAEGGAFYFWRQDYQERIKTFAGVCAYCAEAPATELDHAVPLSRGGTNYAANVYPACRPCNRSKSAKILWTEWQPKALTKER